MNKHVVVFTGVVSLMLLGRLRWRSISIFDFFPPVNIPNINQSIALALCGLILNCIGKAEPSYSYYSTHDSSKTQYIKINTPDG
ncbi:P9 [Calibrachoa mottle virus]|uniref:p9 n=1 Tax=Calibrachoa mottle virus TaxID=204928 RepID=C7E3L4_9TOMB|nr:P9 [Calibrachoa mottle virus]ACT36597.1 P9 [Calibrachoa mottle virus]UEV87754.1 movement protein 2 [Calibrachoa mottle virus]UZN89635.1 movement protein 2 [Calibrachoa mottle virus]WIW79829.1 movement protein 2 [Calibrachoa mottle virus]WNS50451.1 movement protein 2 [Calibrachoa mottle virus]